MEQDLTAPVRAAAFLWAVGGGLVATGALMNLWSRLLPPRPAWDRGLGGIQDRVARRGGPPTWRIGAVILAVATPMLALSLWLT